MDIPGIPARFAGIVNMSARYMLSGSSVLSPILKAGVGEVGVKITSHFLKASEKSFFISVLTFRAFK